MVTEFGVVDVRQLRHLSYRWGPAGMGVVESVECVRPNPYGSRTSSVVVDVRTATGSSARLLLKSGRIGERTRTGAPWGTRYEAATYRGPLAAISIYDSPFLGEIVDRGRSCLVLRWMEEALSVAKAPHPSGIRAAATWLGRFHREAAMRLDPANSAGLTRYGEGAVIAWADLARANLRPVFGSSTAAVEAIEAVAAQAQVLIGSDETLVHGDLYPANVLTTRTRVIPIDWEWAGIGAGELDLAALVDGWPNSTVLACAADYRRMRWPSGGGQGFSQRFAAARFFLAVRWLGGHPVRPGDPGSDHYLGRVEEASRCLGFGHLGRTDPDERR